MAGDALVEILQARGRLFRAAGTRPERLRERFGDVGRRPRSLRAYIEEHARLWR